MKEGPKSLISLYIDNVECKVPESCSILRGFEYLRFYRIQMGGFCWNAECSSCEIVLQTGSGTHERVLACQTRVVEGMRVLEMTEKLRFCLRDLLAGGGGKDQ